MNIVLLTNPNVVEIGELKRYGQVYTSEVTSLSSDVDLVISYCHNHKIKEPLISGPKYGCINFHPAPLPEYKGLAVYNFGILNEETEWGVTCHYVTPEFDKGEIISQTRFPIEGNHTAQSLRDLSHQYLWKEFLYFLENRDKLLSKPRVPQPKEGNYYSRTMLERERIVSPEDPPDLIDKKIRAFHCPPHKGAAIIVGNKEYELKYKEQR